MTTYQSNERAKNVPQAPTTRQLQQRPGESDQAFAARMAYVKLPPGKRSIAAAYRSVKGLEPDAKVKVSGRFGKWAQSHKWREYAAAFDAADQGLTADLQETQLTAASQAQVEEAEALAAAAQRKIERAEKMEAMLDRKVEQLQALFDREDEELELPASPAPPARPAGMLAWLRRLVAGRRDEDEAAKRQAEQRQAELHAAAVLRDLTAAYSNLRPAAAQDTQPQLPPPGQD